MVERVAQQSPDISHRFSDVAAVYHGGEVVEAEKMWCPTSISLHVLARLCTKLPHSCYGRPQIDPQDLKCTAPPSQEWQDVMHQQFTDAQICIRWIGTGQHYEVEMSGIPQCRVVKPTFAHRVGTWRIQGEGVRSKPVHERKNVLVLE